MDPYTLTQAPVAYLDEANVVGVLPEALTADVQVVLADDTTLVAAHTAAKHDTGTTESSSQFCDHARGSYLEYIIRLSSL